MITETLDVIVADKGATDKSYRRWSR